MKSLWALSAFLTICVLHAGPTFSCERFMPLTSETKHIFDILENEQNSSTDRFFALTKLICVSEPVIRSRALELALKSSDKFLSAKALSETLMQREIMTVRIIDRIQWSRGYGRRDIEMEGWTITLKFHDRNRELNCINLASGRAACYARSMISIDGTKVRIIDSSRSFQGEFDLEPNGKLMGKVTFDRNPPASAEINLF